MGNGIGKITSIKENEQVILTNRSGRILVNGPKALMSYAIWTSLERYVWLELKLNEYVFVEDQVDPQNNRFVFGPTVVVLTNPYERVGKPQKCPILDQDDYIVVSDPTGIKRTVKGPGVFRPTYGEVWSGKKEATIVPVNHYLVVHDSNDSEDPVKHIRGPYTFVPRPFQNIMGDIRSCIKVTELQGIHLKKTDGEVILLEKPMWYMPQVGEEVVQTVAKTVMIESEFCILKDAQGVVYVLEGRSFFLKPFHELLKFRVSPESTKEILTKLPSFISHKFAIRTNDNVLLELDIRITYQIQDPSVFGSNPIPFYDHLVNWCQNDLLDVFSKITLRDFMQSYSACALDCVIRGTDYFSKFGIYVLDVQILDYKCVDGHTQSLLDQDIKTHVTKQNELKAKEADVLIQEKENEITKRRKDLQMEITAKDREIEMKNKELQLQMTGKDREIEMKNKELQLQMTEKDREIEIKNKELEVKLRLKELELQVQEEKKRSELISIKQENAVKEAEYEGRAQGKAVTEFLAVLPDSISSESRLQIWHTLRELDRAQMLYSKVGSVNMYPPNADIRLFQVEEPTTRNNNKILSVPHMLAYSGDLRK